MEVSSNKIDTIGQVLVKMATNNNRIALMKGLMWIVINTQRHKKSMQI